jgi:hypothetical protein
MTLYTKNGEYPNQLPHMIRLSNGFIRSDRSTFTAEEIVDAGYIQVEDPPSVEYPNVLDWDTQNLQWVVRAPNDNETQARWQFIQSECKLRLDQTDYKIIKALELSVEPEQAVVTYRQELRDLYNNINNIDPWNFQWPVYISSS